MKMAGEYKYNLGITAKDLQSRTNYRIINEIVQAHIQSIDTHINLAHASGRNYVIYELPSNFSINNLSNADAKLLVYTELLKVLTSPVPSGKGFKNVKIKLGAKSFLYIKWEDGLLSKAEKENRYAILRMYQSTGDASFDDDNISAEGISARQTQDRIL